MNLILRKKRSPVSIKSLTMQKRLPLIGNSWTLLLMLLVLCLFAMPLLAVEQSGVSMEIIVKGRVAKEWPCRGTRYVEAVKNKDYGIRLTNHTGRRMAVALSVDGLNTINGQRTTAWDGPKWVLEPWGTVTVEGWQTSGSEARRFYFTTEKKSYAGKRGLAQNLGNISAVVFRELPKPRPKHFEYDGTIGGARDRSAGAGEERQESLDQAAPSAEAPRSDLRSAEKKKSRNKKADLFDSAATGMGDAMNNPIRRVSLKLDPSPCASMTLRYEFRNVLLAKGVIPRPKPRPKPDPWDRRENSSGFDDMAFAPIID